MFNFPSRLDTSLSDENILKRTTEAEIFRHFLGFDYKLKVFYKSPLRTDDKIPSFNIYPGERGLKYKDWGKSSGSCFQFVMELRHTDFRGALELINSEMGLGLMGGSSKKRVVYDSYKSMEAKKFSIFIRAKARNWKEYDVKFWKQYKISSSTLKLFEVVPAEEVWKRYEGESWRKVWLNVEDNPVYVYKLYRYLLEGGEFNFIQPGIKGYRPYQTEEFDRNSKFKWLNGVRGDYIQGLKQLVENPPDSKVLFITSSLKDVMTLYELGIPAIAPNSEATINDPELMSWLKDRYTIYVNYDNDDPGVNASIKFTQEFGLSYWNIPKSYNVKDVSDFVKTYGQHLLKELICQKVSL